MKHKVITKMVKQNGRSVCRHYMNGHEVQLKKIGGKLHYIPIIGGNIWDDIVGGIKSVFNVANTVAQSPIGQLGIKALAGAGVKNNKQKAKGIGKGPVSREQILSEIAKSIKNKH